MGLLMALVQIRCKQLTIFHCDQSNRSPPPDPSDRGEGERGSEKWGKSVNMDCRGAVHYFESCTESGDEEEKEEYLQIHYNAKVQQEPQEPAGTSMQSRSRVKGISASGRS